GFVFKMQFPSFANCGIGIFVPPEGSGAFNIEAAVVVVANASRSGIEQGLSYLRGCFRRDESDQFPDGARLRDQDLPVPESQLLTDHVIDPLETVVQGGVNGVDGNIIFDCFDDGLLHISGPAEVLYSGKDNGVKAHNEVAVLFQSLVNHCLQGVEGYQHSGDFPVLGAGKQAYIVKTFGIGQGSKLFNGIGDVLDAHFKILNQI